MENNTPQNAQDVVPSLDAVLGGDVGFEQGTVLDNMTNLPTGPQGGEPAPSGNEPLAETPEPSGTPPVTPPANTPANTPAKSAVAPIEDDVVKLLATDDSLLSAEDAEFKTSVYNKFQAVGVDFKGNLLNAEGEVVLTADDFNNYIDTGAVPLDEAGNQINAKGEIITPAEEVKDSASIADLTKALIEEELGYKFLAEDGTPKSYPNSAEGTYQLAKDAIIAAQTSAVSAFLNINPTLKQVFYHLENGGDLNDFTQSAVDYTAIDVNSLSKDQKLDYIRNAYEKQGVTNTESIMKLLESVGEDKITQSTAEALLTLKEISDKEMIAQEKAHQQREQQEQEEADKYWNQIKSVIDKGTLKDLQIPANERLDFYKYIAEPINAKGETREMLDARKESDESQLMISYLRYKGGDVSKLVKSKATTNRLESLKQRMGVNTPIPKIETNKERTNSRGGVFTPSLDLLM